MKVEIPNELLPKLMKQLEVLSQRGGEEWNKTALGILLGILAQETSGRRGRNLSEEARQNRKRIRNRFRTE